MGHKHLAFGKGISVTHTQQHQDSDLIVEGSQCSQQSFCMLTLSTPVTGI